MFQLKHEIIYRHYFTLFLQHLQWEKSSSSYRVEMFFTHLKHIMPGMRTESDKKKKRKASFTRINSCIFVNHWPKSHNVSSGWYHMSITSLQLLRGSHSIQEIKQHVDCHIRNHLTGLITLQTKPLQQQLLHRLGHDPTFRGKHD